MVYYVGKFSKVNVPSVGFAQLSSSFDGEYIHSAF